MTKRTLKQANERIKDLEKSLSMVNLKVRQILRGTLSSQMIINNFIRCALDEKWCQQVKKSYEKMKK